MKHTCLNDKPNDSEKSRSVGLDLTAVDLRTSGIVGLDLGQCLLSCRNYASRVPAYCFVVSLLAKTILKYTLSLRVLLKAGRSNLSLLEEEIDFKSENPYLKETSGNFTS